jgi:hypothetical protein
MQKPKWNNPLKITREIRLVNLGVLVMLSIISGADGVGSAHQLSERHHDVRSVCSTSNLRDKNVSGVLLSGFVVPSGPEEWLLVDQNCPKTAASIGSRSEKIEGYLMRQIIEAGRLRESTTAKLLPRGVFLGDLVCYKKSQKCAFDIRKVVSIKIEPLDGNLRRTPRGMRPNR